MKKLLVSALLVGALLAPLAAFAQGAGNPTDLKNHPRVDQVNKRVQNQHSRIQQGVKSGKISTSQAKQLHGERHAIKTEERGMRKADNGHLTKTDQKMLNKQMNQRSKQIYDEKHP